MLIVVLLYSMACTQEVSEKKAIRRLIVNESGTVFYNPTRGIDDSLKDALGDRYFALRDSLTASNNQLVKLFDSLGIKYQYSDAEVLEFIESDGRKTIIETNKLSAPWGAIHYERGMPPVMLTARFAQNLRLLRTVVPGFILAPETKAVAITLANPKPVIAPPAISEQTELPLTLREYLQINQLEAIRKQLPGDSNTAAIYPVREKVLQPGEYNKISQQALLQVKFDNDIFSNTDIYYTNGIRIEHISPIWQKSPVARLLLSPSRKGETRYGVSIVQNMYTPQFPVREDIQYGDRPFASYLLLGHLCIHNNKQKKHRLTSEIDLGVIGPASLGGAIQSYLHGEEKRPKGWKNQITDDVIANYNLRFEKGMVEKQGHELMVTSAIQAGTLYTSGEIGLKYLWGNRNSYFSDYYNIPSRFSPKQPWHTYFTYQFGFETEMAFIGYDATLQGGMLNQSSPYTIPNSNLKRFVWKSEASLSISYKKYSAAFVQYLTSPEFTDMRWHKWGRIKVTIPL